MKLYTKRLLLQQPVPDDFDRYYEIHASRENNLFNPNGPMDSGRARDAFSEMVQHWEEKGYGSWRISIAESPDLVIGFGGLSARYYGEESKLNLGYRFDQPYWGRGYATELSEYAIQYGFIELEEAIIFAVVRPAHVASIRVLEKCGMLQLGSLDDVPGEAESLVYCIERQQFLNLR